MNSKFKITIPKPCHENWNKMRPKEKGRFCGSCAKTVVDFTKKTTEEIQDYLVENKNQRVCGHFYKKQLDTITIEIPQVTFQQQLSFHKLFVLVLFFVMGTTLFSCQYSDGKKQKIEKVILADTIEKVIKESSIKKDLVFGELPLLPKPTISITDLSIIGDVEEIGAIELEEDHILGFIVIEETPRFKGAKNLSKEEAKMHFQDKIRKFVQENFDKKLTKNLNLREGKYKIYAQFIIGEKGKVSDINVKAPHESLKKEAIRIVEKLPQFIPGKQRGKPVKTKYTLPIAFVVE